MFGVTSCHKGLTKTENGVTNIVRENKQCLMEASYACSVYTIFFYPSYINKSLNFKK